MAMSTVVSEAMTELSLQLLRSPQSGSPPREFTADTWIGTATLVSPRLAVTTGTILDRWRDQSVPIRVRRIGSRDDVGAAIIVDPTSPAFAIVEIEADLPIAAGEEPLRSTAELDPTAEWEAAFAPPESPDRLRVAQGRIGSRVTIDGQEYLSLTIDERQEGTAGFWGAPVIAGGRVVGVLARTPERSNEWHALPLSPEMIGRWRERQPRSSPPTPDAAATGEFQAGDFFKALSPSSWRALEHANGMRLRWEQDRIHMEHLIMGLYLKEDGPAERLFRSAGIASAGELRTLLSKEVELGIPEPDQYQPTPLGELPPVSEHVEAAFRAAKGAAEARRSRQIQSRHLLYGALSVTDCSVVQALLRHGVRRQAIALDDQPQAEGPTLAVVSSTSDIPGGEDLLGIEQEVDAISALIASNETTTPLSIGLFGDWGSGKSFFMQRMDQRIRQLRDGARANPDLPFRHNIVQLWFNAWHYIDRSLWASLGAEIFEGLAHSLAAEGATKDGRKELEDARTLLVARRALFENQHRAAQEAVLSSAAAVRKHEEVIRIIESRTDGEIERSLGTKATLEELVQLITSQPEIKDDLDRTAKQIGMSELATATGALRGQVESLVAMSSYWKTALATARSRAGAKWWLVGAGVAALVLLLQTQLFGMVLGLEGMMRKTAAVLTAGLSLLAPVLAVAGRATGLIRDANQRMSDRIKAKRQAELAIAEASRQAAQKQAEDDARALSQVRQQLQDIDREIDRLKPVRQLTDFVRARHQSDDYTKHFGVIARARQDFEELTRLMELVREQPTLATSGEKSDHFTPIDRIVLYIDDLDRCPEAKVFQVLQAVHLLLAFPLFVVVVGVDPRWLLHSLRRELGAFRDQPDEEVEGEEERLHWQSTPLNYLEKIFQIPFTVRPMNQRGFDRMIEELTARDSRGSPKVADSSSNDVTPGAKPAAKGANTPAPALADASNGTGGGPTNLARSGPAASEPVPDAVTGPVAQQKALLIHNRLQLESWERDYMKRLFPLIPSPRASKRFVNVYRLLRAVVSGAERRELIGSVDRGGYREVLLLLAMVTGYPGETTALIARLLDEGDSSVSKGDWWEFVDLFKHEMEQLEQSAATPENGSSADSIEDKDARWRRFFGKLHEVHGQLEDELTCSTMTRWVPVVARYSFASGRLLLGGE